MSNEKFGAAIIGYGGMGSWHARQLKTMEDCMQFYSEHFRYDSHGLLEESSLKDTFDKFTRICRFKFFHDPQGFLSSYLSGDEQGNYSPNIYQIPACKRRRI